MDTVRESARNWMRELFVWDHSQKQEIARAAMALGFGLNPQQFVRPFPGSNTSTTINVSPPAASPQQPVPSAIPQPAGVLPIPSAAWRGWLPLAAGLLGAGGLTVGVLSSLSRPAVPAVVPQTATAAQPQEWEIRWSVGPDGKWQTDTRPVKP